MRVLSHLFPFSLSLQEYLLFSINHPLFPMHNRIYAGCLYYLLWQDNICEIQYDPYPNRSDGMLKPHFLRTMLHARTYSFNHLFAITFSAVYRRRKMIISHIVPFIPLNFMCWQFMSAVTKLFGFSLIYSLVCLNCIKRRCRTHSITNWDIISLVFKGWGEDTKSTWYDSHTHADLHALLIAGRNV